MGCPNCPRPGVRVANKFSGHSAACVGLRSWHPGSVRWTPFLQSPVGIALRYVLTLGLLGWLALRVDWAGLSGLRALDWRMAVPAVLLAGVAYPLQIVRWQLLLRAQGFVLPARAVHAAGWSGIFFNSFLPGGIAGDAVRFGLLWRHAPDRKAAAASGLVADRLLGLAALFALAALALGLHILKNGGGRDQGLLLAASGGALGGLLVGAVLLPRTQLWAPLATRFLGAELSASLVEAVQPLTGARVATVALLVSFAVWLVDFAALWLLARSVGLSADFLGLSAAAAAAYVAAALPISIGGHGLREGTLVATLAVLGIGLGQAQAVALLAVAFLAVSVGWSLVGGLVVLFQPRTPVLSAPPS